jgi:hypothetical protein
MTSPVSHGDFPAPDFMGWAFTTLGKLDFFGNHVGNLILPLIAIANPLPIPVPIKVKDTWSTIPL